VLVEAELEASPASLHSEWLFKRADLRRRMDDLEGARADYRAAMNADPHLRRALDAMNDRVRAVAKRTDAELLDAVDLLSRAAEDGIVGFDEFYDYVHMTPRGAVIIAGEVFRKMQRMNILPPAPGFDTAAFERAQLTDVAAVTEDALDVTEWMGFGFDPAQIFDRDLWKYDRFVTDLDDRIAENPADVRALTYRGNANFFLIDGAQQAERDYRAALALREDAAIRSNLQRLLAERAS
jgi:tetratricopeptide (TPR) repeat protein